MITIEKRKRNSSPKYILQPSIQNNNFLKIAKSCRNSNLKRKKIIFKHSEMGTKIVPKKEISFNKSKGVLKDTDQMKIEARRDRGVFVPTGIFP